MPEICLVENILMGKKSSQKSFFDYMERNPEVDGIFCTSDMIAAQLFSGMSVHETDLYRKIPVIGFDGFEIAEWMDLSTISQPIQEMGECAVEMLIKKIEGKIAPEKLTLLLMEIDTAVKYRTFSWKAGKIINKKMRLSLQRQISFFFFISPLQNRL